ncbi:MAG: hypothetical protein K9K32_07630 [Halanaerobiales bacterium]|nr:hypothetical protein [Halanaerobiales bacterium]
MNNKEKAVEILKNHGYEAQLDDLGDIDIFYDARENVTIFYSNLRDKFHISTTSMTVGVEDGIEFERKVSNAILTLAELREEVPELVKRG